MTSSSERMDIILGAVNDFSEEFEAFRAGMTRNEKKIKNTSKANKKATKTFKALKASIKSVGKAFLALVAGPLALFTAGVFKSANQMSAMAKEAQKIQISTSEMSRLAYVGSQTGVEIDDVVGSVEELRLRMAEAVQDGSGPLGLAFKKLGLDAEAMLNLPVSEQLGMVGDALKKLNAGDRQFLADEIFGGDAVRMMGFINQGSEGIAELSARADELGITMSDSGAQGASEFKKAWSEMWDVVNGILDSMMEPVIRWLGGFFRVMSNAINQWDVTWSLMSDVVSLAFLKVYEDAKDTLMRKLPIMFDWLRKNWLNLFRDYYMIVFTALKNISLNFIETFRVIADSIASILTGGSAGDMWTKVGQVWAGGILEGFESTIEELPQIAEREATVGERVLADRAAASLAQLQAGTTDLTTEAGGGNAAPKESDVARKDWGAGLAHEFGKHFRDTLDKQKTDKGGGFSGQLTGSSNRFLQTGRSISVSPEKQTAKNTEMIDKKMAEVKKGIDVVSSVLGNATGKANALKVELISGATNFLTGVN